MDGKTGLVDSLIEENLDRIEEIRSRYDLETVQPHLEACRDLLQEKDTIDVGVFGRFKAGKSSFLNHLAGRPVLPVGVTPVTAAITRIRYGPRERAAVEFRDGRITQVPPDSIRSYIAESDNPGNRRKVASVTVELPSLHTFRGLQFVDTPGLDSIFQHNTDAALAWLPKVGLAVVTIGVDPPLSRQDVALIRRLRSFTPRIAIVVTKADLVSESERIEITDFIHGELRREFESDFPILTFSTRPAYESMKDNLERAILHPLVENHESTHADILRFKFDVLVKQTSNYLSLALAAAERADSDRLALKKQILDEQTSFDSVRSELIALGREYAGQTRPWIMRRMTDLQPGIEKKITAELASRLSGSRANLWKTSRSFEEWLSELMARELNAVSREEGALFCAPLEKAQAAFSRAVQGFRDRLAGNIYQTLGMTFSPEPFEAEVRKPGSPPISIGNLFMFHIDLLWFVIPMTFLRPWIQRRLLRRPPLELEKNLSRLASQWTDAINASIGKIEKQAIASVRGQIATVESVLSRTQSDADEIRNAINTAMGTVTVPDLRGDGDSGDCPPSGRHRSP